MMDGHGLYTRSSLDPINEIFKNNFFPFDNTNDPQSLRCVSLRESFFNVKMELK